MATRILDVTVGNIGGGDSEAAGIADDLVLTDALLVSAGEIRSDNMGLTDAVTRVVSNVETRSDNLNLTDSVSAVKTGIPSAPTTLSTTNLQDTSVRLLWSEVADASVTKHGLYQGSTLLVDNISASALQYDWTGLLPSTQYSNINIRRFNSTGWSAASPTVTFTTAASGASPLLLGHVPGKLYFGWSTSHTEGTTSGTAEFQLNNQTPFTTAAPSGQNYSGLLGVRRLYNKSSTDINYIDSQNRVLWLSAKGDELGASTGVTGWGQIASGSRDANIISYFNSLVSRNKLTIWTFHHEPIGDISAPTDATTYNNACLRIMQVVDSNYPGHRIVFCPNYEENRLLRNLQAGGGSVRWDLWCPASMLPGLGGTRPFDFISFDIYQYGADTNSTPLSTHSAYFANRWQTVEAFFEGNYVPTGTTASSIAHLNYTVGTDFVLGIGEGTGRPGAFYYWETGTGTNAQQSNLTGAKYARNYLDYVFNNPEHFYAVSWFNSIGADILYNDERLYPNAATWGGKTQTVNLTQQTGDTEYSINVYREKLLSGLTVKLASNGLPPA